MHEQGKAALTDAPVLIVGAGPVGMTLASELARYGVRVRIVDQAAQRTEKSKALVLWSRTLELLDRGVGAAPFVEAGFKVHGVTFVTGNDVVGRVAVDSVPSDYTYALMIPQSETERLLEEHLGAQGVSVEREITASGFEIEPDGVCAVLRHADGREEAVSAEWLIGCDGAHSAVRHAVGAPFTGETLESDWMLADVHMSGYPRPDTEASVHWHRDGVLIIFPIVPGRYRVIANLALSSAEHPPTPTLDIVQAQLDRRGSGGMTVFDPVWLSGFRINDRKVAAYRYGRVFLAGDAAHIHSPAGGQGMNTGMQDAFNLAWKLALVIRGAARDRLLDSYSPERSHVGDQVLKSAGRLTAVGTLKSPLLQELRNVVGHLMLGLSPVTRAVANTMSEIAIHYPESPLNGPSAGVEPHPGERVRPVAGSIPAGSGDAPRFALFAARTSEMDDLVASYPDLVDRDVRPALQDGVVSLVRPDGYLASSARDTREIPVYLERIASDVVRP